MMNYFDDPSFRVSSFLVVPVFGAATVALFVFSKLMLVWRVRYSRRDDLDPEQTLWSLRPALPKTRSLIGEPIQARWVESYDELIFQLTELTHIAFNTNTVRLVAGCVFVSVGLPMLVLIAALSLHILSLFEPATYILTTLSPSTVETTDALLTPLAIHVAISYLLGVLTGLHLARPKANWLRPKGKGGGRSKGSGGFDLGKDIW